MLQEDVESYGNQLSSGDPVYNFIHKSPRSTKSCFYVDPCKRQKYIIVLMRTVSIPNIDITVWTRKFFSKWELPTFLNAN